VVREIAQDIRRPAGAMVPDRRCFVSGGPAVTSPVEAKKVTLAQFLALSLMPALP
jgi:hypothetical protein